MKQSTNLKPNIVFRNPSHEVLFPFDVAKVVRFLNPCKRITPFCRRNHAFLDLYQGIVCAHTHI
jgi:hypothetical protein